MSSYTNADYTGTAFTPRMGKIKPTQLVFQKYLEAVAARAAKEQKAKEAALLTN